MDILSKARIAHELSSVSIAVAEYLLKNYEIVKKNAKKIQISRDLLKKELKKIGLETRSQFGNYILIKFQNSTEAEKVVKFLKKNYIYVKGPYKHPWQNFINISIGPYNAMKPFIKKVKEAKKKKLFT